MNTTPLLLQIHVPFCVRRCAHCAYPVIKYEPDLAAAYGKALLKELESAAEDMQDYEVIAVAFEGGSPALLAPADLQAVLRSIRRHFRMAPDVQICLPTMPGDYSRSLMEKMRDNGVNFWIVGLETVSLNEHGLLKRPYRYDALTMVDTALKTFHPRDVSFDLLAGIPGQTLSSWKGTLDRVMAYEPDHISILPLNPHGSLLQADATAGLVQLMHDEQICELSDFAREYLETRSFHAYTQFDYAKEGKENRFRLGQMHGISQLGIGYRAVTIMDGYRYTNGHSLEEYLLHPDDVTVLANGVTQLEGEALAAYEKSLAMMRPTS